VKFKEAEEEQ